MKTKTKNLLASLLRLLLALLTGAGVANEAAPEKATKCGFVPERGEDSALSDGGKALLG